VQQTVLVPRPATHSVCVLLLNDFESAEIDATRLTAMNSIVTPLSGECVCCSSLDSLLDTLGTMPVAASSVTLIEANGARERGRDLLCALRDSPLFGIPRSSGFSVLIGGDESSLLPCR